MTELKTDQEKKKYILKTWKLSSGKRISEMVKRYWCTPKQDTLKLADEIFGK